MSTLLEQQLSEYAEVSFSFFVFHNIIPEDAESKPSEMIKLIQIDR